MPNPFHSPGARALHRDPENVQKKRKHTSDPEPDRRKRTCSDNTYHSLPSHSVAMERENSRNDFSFLERKRVDQHDMNHQDMASEYDAIARYMEEPINHDHQRTGVERHTSATRADLGHVLDDPPKQQRRWMEPRTAGSLAGIGSWTYDHSTR